MIKVANAEQDKNHESAKTIKEKRIILTGGGTAGHVLPNIALLPYLEKEFSQIHYIGSEKGIEREIIKKHPHTQYHVIQTAKLRRSLSPKSIAKNLAMPFKVLSGIKQAKKILKKIKPNIIFSKGGFVAYPVVRAGAKLGIPVIIHESDLTIGLTNKVSTKYATQVLTSFEETAQNLAEKLGEQRVKFVGTPLRQEIFQGRAEYVENLFGQNSEPDRKKLLKKLLVIGGSLGAAKINHCIRDLVSSNKLSEWKIMHVVGKGKMAELENKNSNYIQVEYVDGIADAYAWADMVISRAGSGSICELLVLRKPTLLIPLASGRGDQIENAKNMYFKGLMNVLFEENLTPEILCESLETQSNFAKDNFREEVEEIQEIHKNSAKRVANIIIKLS